MRRTSRRRRSRRYGRRRRRNPGVLPSSFGNPRRRRRRRFGRRRSGRRFGRRRTHGNPGILQSFGLGGVGGPVMDTASLLGAEFVGHAAARLVHSFVPAGVWGAPGGFLYDNRGPLTRIALGLFGGPLLRLVGVRGRFANQINKMNLFIGAYLLARPFANQLLDSVLPKTAPALPGSGGFSDYATSPALSGAIPSDIEDYATTGISGEDPYSRYLG
jgi:hypothetical protein